MAWHRISAKEEATERPPKLTSVSKLGTNLGSVDKLVDINERPAGACL